MTGAAAPPHLSKALYTAGVQCHKLLWWKVHDADAVELQPDKVLQDRFDQGRQVGELARERFAGGVLLERHAPFEQRTTHTRAALADTASTLFEASFEADDVHVAVDVLQRVDGGVRLIEVKSASSQKDEHIPDAALQAHVLARSGLDVQGVEIMHLNKDFRHPDQGDLFARTDVTAQVHDALAAVPAEIAAQLAALRGPLPDVPIGLHCFEPRACPFRGRCWPDAADHIIKLYNVGPRKAADYMATGVHAIGDVPAGKKLPDAARRQVRALRENRLIVEPGLRAALAPFSGRLGFLDFETITRAVPVWPGMAPWEQAAAQFSYHETQPDGTYRHVAHLAEGPHDARPALAQAMVAATADAERVVMYTSFERTRIRSLQKTVPDLAAELKGLEDKLIDLHPVIRDHVYHPEFNGSFSLKYVLHPLVPDLTYHDLVIVDGLVASVEIARLLFVAHRIPAAERDRVRQDLLNYCERDTWAMVRVLERLRELAG
jgi:predicted RecB family nuclease